MSGKMQRVSLKRNSSSGSETLGELSLENGSVLHTLELPWKNNRRNISCIPLGTYEVIGHVSPKFGKCYWVKDVPGRSEILFHVGNSPKDSRGCILVGQKVVANRLVSSKIAMSQLLNELSWPNSFILDISMMRSAE